MEVKQIFHQPERRNYTTNFVMKISPDVLNNVNSLMVKVLRMVKVLWVVKTMTDSRGSQP